MFERSLTQKNEIDELSFITNASISPINTVNLYSEMSIQERLKSFPTTRYYGSKRRILNWIYDCIKDYSFNTVLDGFGGTASVSLLFKAMGKKVTFNDSLHSNTITARALLTNKNPISKKAFEKTIDSISSFEGIISSNFKGIFYTNEENNWLDDAINKIKELKSFNRNFYLYCIFQACLQKRPFNLFHRANLNLRTNLNQERTFGNLVTWNTPFSNLAKRAFEEIESCIWDSGKEHKVLKPSDICSLKCEYDLVYLDPPYLGSKGKEDNYLSRYHFLEGLANYDSWLNQINFDSKSLTFKQNDLIEKWHDKNRFTKLLFDLVEYHKNSIVVLSYPKDSHPSIEVISQHFSRNFSKTEVHTKAISQALSKRKREEALIIGLP